MSEASSKLQGRSTSEVVISSKENQKQCIKLNVRKYQNRKHEFRQRVRDTFARMCQSDDEPLT